MAELVDALVSGTSSRKGVQVRVLFRAQWKEKAEADGLRPFFISVKVDPKGQDARH